ncbi:MAG: hypothetical protein JSR19_11655 [Proteobacteria bacterium]|nr:hypothetical protein [Pseudomonadota bacterium]HQR02694.1 hypothetical protein [Rhodocyclaceae bacterium]
MYIGRTLEEKPIPMDQFNPGNVVQVAREYLATLTGSRQRQILENFIEHAEAECGGRYEELMASCSQERQVYAAYGAGADYSAYLPQDYTALTQHYRNLIAANIYLIHMEVEKLIVGEDELVVEGIVHQLHSGAMIETIHGIRMDDPAAVYQLTKRTCIFFVFDPAGKGAGELAYSNGPTTAADIVKVDPAKVPPAFWRNPLAPAVG